MARGLTPRDAGRSPPRGPFADDTATGTASAARGLHPRAAGCSVFLRDPAALAVADPPPVETKPPSARSLCVCRTGGGREGGAASSGCLPKENSARQGALAGRSSGQVARLPGAAGAGGVDPPSFASDSSRSRASVVVGRVSCTRPSLPASSSGDGVRSQRPKPVGEVTEPPPGATAVHGAPVGDSGAAKG